ncbi:hypothetical protein [Filomicrobium sp.]|uniref:hypothetical protein n=1 Tax=Filomicrobium sp. TaxID=2024831 RepID=UPI002586C818|nr:hypothetical protein [Filomicrobium sp.]MCV0371109.1 hypothetical protein [Filomicrobium sp.]
MKVTPILFSGPMVCALLREIEKPGTGKTQTRRVLSPDNIRFMRGGINEPIVKCTPTKEMLAEALEGARNMRLIEHVLTWDCPGAGYVMANLKYAPGDLLWVRETWCEGPIGRDGVVEDWREYFYRATDHDVMGIDDGDGFSVLNADGSLKSPWRPSIHMPRRASRLTLEVTDVRVERLQDISEEDAIAEGVSRIATVGGAGWQDYSGGVGFGDPRRSFLSLWDSLNEARGFGWDVNPWVVAVTFKVHRVNIDALLEKLTKYACEDGVDLSDRRSGEQSDPALGAAPVQALGEAGQAP